MERENTPQIETILSPAFWMEGEVMFQTSGSTGAAKHIVLTKQALLLSARAVNDWLRVDAAAVWGLALPLHHVGGFGVAARAYAAGCGLSVYEGKWNAARFSEWIAKENVTHVSLVPTQIYDLLAEGFQAPPSLVAVVVGGGKLTAEAGQAARDKGWPVLASYGMTEAASQIATQSLASLAALYCAAPLEILPIWEAEESPAGLLCIKGKALYAGSIELGKFHRREGEWFTTQDRVTVSARTLIVHGRADLLVKVMGELVDVEALERRFHELAQGAVCEGSFAVIAIPDPRREHALLAVFEKPDSATEAAYAAYQAQAPGHERFTRYHAIEFFPRNDLGKLRRAELQRRLEEP